MIRNLALGAGAILLCACTTTVINNSPSSCPAETGTLTVGPLTPQGMPLAAYEGDTWTFQLDTSPATVSSAKNAGTDEWGSPGARTCTASTSSTGGMHCDTLTLSCPAVALTAYDLSVKVDLPSNVATVEIGPTTSGTFTFDALVTR